MPDVVLNTHVFELLLDDEFVDKILKVKVHVFVAKCAYRKEYRARHAQLVNILDKNARKLGSFFHCRDACNPLPADLTKALNDEHASDCDTKIAALACDRNRSGHEVLLVSNDPHFTLLTSIFEIHGVRVLGRDDFQHEPIMT